MQILRPERRLLAAKAYNNRRTIVWETSPPRQQAHEVGVQKNRALLHSWCQEWLPRLLQQQEEAIDTSSRLSEFNERVAVGATRAESELSTVMDQFVAAFAAVKRGKEWVPRPALSSNGNSQSGAVALAALLDPANLAQLPEAAHEDLAVIVADIQHTNQQLRDLEQSFEVVDSSLSVLQEGAEQRDQQMAAYRDALLQLADQLEQEEREEQERLAELARREAEELRRVAEARKAEEAQREEQMRREMEALIAAASAAQAAEASLAVAETSTAALAAASPVKLEVGVKLRTKPGQQVCLVGGLPVLGSWKTDAALPMTWTDGHVWKACIELAPAECQERLEYKAILRSGDKCVWEKGDNHVADLAGSSDVSLYHVFQT
eukprot:gene10892-11043_t